LDYGSLKIIILIDSYVERVRWEFGSSAIKSLFPPVVERMPIRNITSPFPTYNCYQYDEIPWPKPAKSSGIARTVNG